MKYDPNNHIIGKVYDLTQENMNAMLDELQNLKENNDALHMTLNVLTAENARYREALEFYANSKKWEIVFVYDKEKKELLFSSDGIIHKSDIEKDIGGGRRAREALKGE